MEINYTIVIPVLILIVVLIIFLIARNNRDKKKYEKEVIDSETKPQSHDSEKI